MKEVEQDQVVSVYLDSHLERLTVTEIIMKMKIYGRSFAMSPVTMKNRIVFVMILFLVFFLIGSPIC